jgi:hypothetical protein
MCPIWFPLDFISGSLTINLTAAPTTKLKVAYFIIG